MRIIYITDHKVNWNINEFMHETPNSRIVENYIKTGWLVWKYTWIININNFLEKSIFPGRILRKENLCQLKKIHWFKFDGRFERIIVHLQQLCTGGSEIRSNYK